MRSYRRAGHDRAGFIQPHGRPDVPAGWLPCDGRAIERAAYPRLFAAIGTAYGAGDGSTTFNVPDMRDRVAVGVGSQGRGAKFGAANRTPSISVTVNNHTLTVSQIASHPHTLQAGRYSLESGPYGPDISGGDRRETKNTDTAGGSGAHGHSANASSSSIDMHQPSIAVNFIIKT